MSLVAAIAAIIIILLPASFYYYCESDWSYVTSIYYCSLTLATAGLGDFVPMKSKLIAARVSHCIRFDLGVEMHDGLEKPRIGT